MTSAADPSLKAVWTHGTGNHMVKGHIKRDTLPCIYDEAQVLSIRIEVYHVDRMKVRRSVAPMREGPLWVVRMARADRRGILLTLQPRDHKAELI